MEAVVTRLGLDYNGRQMVGQFCRCRWGDDCISCHSPNVNGRLVCCLAGRRPANSVKVAVVPVFPSSRAADLKPGKFLCQTLEYLMLGLQACLFGGPPLCSFVTGNGDAVLVFLVMRGSSPQTTAGN